jgi:hypothetical protein
MKLPTFLSLDPLQWLLVLSALLGAVLAVYLSYKDRPIRFTIVSFFVFNCLVVARYVIVILFKQGITPAMTETEINVINQLSQVSQIYIVWTIVISEITKVVSCKKRLNKYADWRGGIQ